MLDSNITRRIKAVWHLDYVYIGVDFVVFWRSNLITVQQVGCNERYAGDANLNGDQSPRPTYLLFPIVIPDIT